VPPVAGDPAALRELLTNLVLNAADALPHGGWITVETRVDGAAVVLAVGDTGVGMSDDDAIDVLLTDLVMPGMTGWELADAVKARHARLAVGVLTGWGDLPDTGAASRGAVDFVLAKPITLEILADALARIG